MITLGQIQAGLKEMKRHQTTVQQLQAALDADIARINGDGTRHAAYVAEKTAEARSKATPAIYKILSEINTLHEGLLKGAGPWQDKRFILAQKPLTEPLNSISGAKAKDPGVEAMARLSKLTEYRLMDADQLHMLADVAKREKRFAELHLACLENNSRDHKQPGWTPIDLADVVIPDQQEALQLLAEGNKIASGISSALKMAEGKAVSPVDAINGARGCPPPLIHPAPAGSPKDRLTAAREG